MFFTWVSLFKNRLHLDIHNNKLFGPASKVYIRFNDTPSNKFYSVYLQPHNEMCIDKYLFKYLIRDMTNI